MYNLAGISTIISMSFSKLHAIILYTFRSLEAAKTSHAATNLIASIESFHRFIMLYVLVSKVIDIESYLPACVCAVHSRHRKLRNFDAHQTDLQS